MPTVLAEHPALAAAIRRLLSPDVGAGEAADAMAQLAALTKAIPLHRLDPWERAIRHELWAAGSATGEASWKPWGRPRRVTAWLDLCSHDGRQREAALRMIAGGAPSAFFLALAIRRLNDWVPEVRLAARQALPALAANTEPRDLADVLWSLLPRWGSWRRMEPADTDAVAAMTSSEPVSLALKAKIMEATGGPAALVLQQAVRWAGFDSGVQEFARGASQPAVRARAWRWLFQGQVSWVAGHQWKWTDIAYCEGKREPIVESRRIPPTRTLAEMLDAALADGSPMVRRVAAEFLIRDLHLLGEDALRFARRTASDRSPMVAERGIFALKRLEQATPSG